LRRILCLFDQARLAVDERPADRPPLSIVEFAGEGKTLAQSSSRDPE
jgi:hypothetical protein